jgi:Rha family phage regulatory protein
MEELVFKSAKGNPVTTSLLVAEILEKNHKELLRDISNLLCSDDFRQRNFALSSYRTIQNKNLPMHIMTRNGFPFLVLGYTGEKSGQ